jgi:hypothetical protein
MAGRGTVRISDQQARVTAGRRGVDRQDLLDRVS